MAAPFLVPIAFSAFFGVSFDVTAFETQANASPRPTICPAAGKRPTIWQRLRTPTLAGYCEQMALAEARLAAAEPTALAAVEAAEKELPGQATTERLRGRILLARAQKKEALAAFENSKKIDKDLLFDPASLRDYGMALRWAGQYERASNVMRTLIPQAGLLGKHERDLSLLEGAFLAMAAFEEEKAPKAESLQEPQAYLQELREDKTSDLATEALLAAALLVDRQGDPQRATSLAKEAVRLGAGQRIAFWAARDRDHDALAALAKEFSHPAAAALLWQSYLTHAKDSPFAGAAKARLAELQKRGAKPVRKPSVRP